MKRRITTFLLILLIFFAYFPKVSAASEQITFSTTHTNSDRLQSYYYQTFTIQYKARIVSFSAYYSPYTGSPSVQTVLRQGSTTLCTSSTVTVTSEAYYTMSFSSCVIPAGSYELRQYPSPAYNVYVFYNTNDVYPDGRVGPAPLDGDQRAYLTLYYNDVYQITTNTSYLGQGKTVRIYAHVRVSEDPQSVRITITSNGTTYVSQASMTRIQAGQFQIYQYDFYVDPSYPEGYYNVSVTSVGSSATAFSDTENANNLFYVYGSRLATPKLSSPLGDWKATSTVIISWQPVVNANQYRVQISRYQDFSTLDLNVTTSSTSMTYYAPQNARFYYRVRAEDTTNSWLPSSWNSSYFTVDTAPPFITLVGPSNGSVVRTAYTTLYWSSSDNFGIRNQTVRVRTPNGTQRDFEHTNTTASRDIVSDDGPVYWRVLASDFANNKGISDERVVIFDNRLPQAPELIEPANNSWMTSDRATLSWRNTDPDCRSALLVINRQGGGYTFSQAFPCTANYTLIFPSEGSFVWYVRADDWAGNSASSENRVFYVVIGSLVPINLTANSTGFSFVVKETSGATQTFNYVAQAYHQSGALASQISGSGIVSASSTVKVSNSWSSTLSDGIYKLRVTVYDSRGNGKTNETWFLVAVGSGGRDWTQWVCDENEYGKEVNFTRLFFEFGTSEAAHQVQLAVQGRPSSCQVFLLNSSYGRVKELPCNALSNYVTFTAEARASNEAKIYSVSVFMPAIESKLEKVRENVVYKQVLCDAYNLSIRNNYAYPISKFKVNASGMLGYEPTIWRNESSYLTYYELSPGKGAFLIMYKPVLNTETEKARLSFDYSPVLILLVLGVFGYVLARRRREGRWREGSR
ncbi:MAG: hypothetical protein QXG08_03220 [Candidatus Methanomethyliaceae archaeon]